MTAATLTGGAAVPLPPLATSYRVPTCGRQPWTLSHQCMTQQLPADTALSTPLSILTHGKAESSSQQGRGPLAAPNTRNYGPLCPWDFLEKHCSPQPALPSTHPPLSSGSHPAGVVGVSGGGHCPQRIQTHHSTMRLQRSLQRHFGAHESEGLSTWWGGMSPTCRGRAPHGTALLPERELCSIPQARSRAGRAGMMGPSNSWLTGSAVNW